MARASRIVCVRSARCSFSRLVRCRGRALRIRPRHRRDLYTPVVNGQCLPALDAGTYDACEVFATLPSPGPQSDCTKISGLSIPDSSALYAFQHEEVESAPGDAGALLNFPVCVLQRLPVSVGETCVTSPAVGWCELPGLACSSAVVFSNEVRAQIKGASYVLRCPPG